MAIDTPELRLSGPDPFRHRRRRGDDWLHRSDPWFGALASRRCLPTLRIPRRDDVREMLGACRPRDPLISTFAERALAPAARTAPGVEGVVVVGARRVMCHSPTLGQPSVLSLILEQIGRIHHMRPLRRLLGWRGKPFGWPRLRPVSREPSRLFQRLLGREVLMVPSKPSRKEGGSSGGDQPGHGPSGARSTRHVRCEGIATVTRLRASRSVARGAGGAGVVAAAMMVGALFPPFVSQGCPGCPAVDAAQVLFTETALRESPDRGRSSGWPASSPPQPPSSSPALRCASWRW